MYHFLKCLIYLILLGIFGFLLGRFLPKSLFRGDAFPFRTFRWEKDGKIYNRIGIRRWKEKLPDMSALFPRRMPSKSLPGHVDSARLDRMVQETCVAEWIHGLLGIAGFGCALIWKKIWGWVLSVLYLLINIPFILIQRYNRPKLIRILRKVRAKENAESLRGAEGDPETPPA